MNPVFVSLLTVCGLDELADHSMRGVTHVLSILDPDWPEPDAFRAYDPHHRTTLQFHDVIEPAPGLILPDVHHVEAIFSFGYSLARDASRGERHLLVHCHMGISRSTAAMLVLLAQAHPQEHEERSSSACARSGPKHGPTCVWSRLRTSFSAGAGGSPRRSADTTPDNSRRGPTSPGPCGGPDARARSIWACVPGGPECGSGSTGAGPRSRRSP